MPYVIETDMEEAGVSIAFAAGLNDVVRSVGFKYTSSLSRIFGVIECKGKGWDNRLVKLTLSIDKDMIGAWIAALQAEETRLENS